MPILIEPTLSEIIVKSNRKGVLLNDKDELKDSKLSAMIPYTSLNALTHHPTRI